jgi:hypothetical protein
MGKAKDSFNNLFVYDDKKKNSKAMRITIVLFLLFISFALIIDGVVSIKLMKKSEVEPFSASSLNGQYVSIDVDKVYSPCAYTLKFWKISGYYCLAETTNGEYYIIYFSAQEWEEFSFNEFFHDDTTIGLSKDLSGIHYEGALSSMEKVIGQRAVSYYEIYVDKGCKTDINEYSSMFTPYFMSVGDRSVLINDYGMLIGGILLFAAVTFVAVKSLRKSKDKN